VTRRRKRRPLLREALALWAAVAVVLLAVTAWHLAGWLLASAAIAGGAYLLGRKSASRQVRPAARPTAALRGPQAARTGTARTRANGWTQPASRLYSAECARSDCLACRDPQCCCTDCPHAYRLPAVRASIPDEPQF
jgi:hypothetical protein